MPRIAAILQPLTDALAGGPKKLCWSKEISVSLKQAKSALAGAVLLAHPLRGAKLQLVYERSGGSSAATSQGPAPAPRVFQ